MPALPVFVHESSETDMFVCVCYFLDLMNKALFQEGMDYWHACCMDTSIRLQQMLLRYGGNAIWIV